MSRDMSEKDVAWLRAMYNQARTGDPDTEEDQEYATPTEIDSFVTEKTEVDEGLELDIYELHFGEELVSFQSQKTCNGRSVK